MNYRRNVMKAAALTGMIVLGMVQGAGAEDAVDIEELFYTYSSDTQVYDYTESAYLYGWLSSLEYKNYNGYLALDQLDLNWDGSEELLAVRVKQPDENTNRNNLVAEVYQYEGDKLKRVAQCTLAEDILTLNAADIEVFLVNTDNGIYLCCEENETAGILADGVEWNLKTFTYDGADFVQQTDTGILGSTWEDTDLAEARDALNSLGLYPAELVTTSIPDQVENLTRISTIQRYLTASMDDIMYYKSNPESEMMEYGETMFHSYRNENRENKGQKNFAAAAEHSDSGQQTASTETVSSGDYIIPDSSSRYITEEDLTGLSDYEILLARNEIYARHGRMFVNEDLDSYFRSKSWYQPTVSGSDFTEEYAASVFNDFERTNIDTIVKYEQAHNINQF